MKEIIELIGSGKLAGHSVIASMTDGGEVRKALFSANELVHCTSGLKFFKDNLDQLTNQIKTTGLYNIEGKEVFCEVVEEEPELVVCGAGHVGAACIKLAKFIGMPVTCIEDRPEFAEIAKKAGADRVICENWKTALDKIKGGKNIFFLSLQRAHAIDQDCLERILRKERAYLGMLGSAGKIRILKANLAELGVSEELFDTVYTPVGLDINANTAEEIAMAIIAQIIQIKNTDLSRNKAFSNEQMDAVLNGKDAMMLVTMVRKEMASPREPGTKMIVRSDGSKIGTIGGGLAEAQAARISVEKLADDTFCSELIRVGENDAQNTGMICGGVIDVLIERI